jgi:hypothetical protein
LAWNAEYLRDLVRVRLRKARRVDPESFVQIYIQSAFSHVQSILSGASAELPLVRFYVSFLRTLIFWLNILTQIGDGTLDAREIVSPVNLPFHLQAPQSEAGAVFLSTLETFSRISNDDLFGVWSDSARLGLGEARAASAINNPTALIATHIDYLAVKSGVSGLLPQNLLGVSDVELKRRTIREEFSSALASVETNRLLASLERDQELLDYFLSFELWHSAQIMEKFLVADQVTGAGNAYERRWRAAHASGDRAVFALAMRAFDTIENRRIEKIRPLNLPFETRRQLISSVRDAV